MTPRSSVTSVTCLRSARHGCGRRPSRHWAVVLFALPLALGCGDENLAPLSPRSPADLFWSLQLNHHAVALSAADATAEQYKTLQLVATPLNFRGETLPGLPAPQYSSTDPERVLVTAAGMLVAVAPTTQPVAVITTLTTENIKHTDTVLVSIVEDPAPPLLASFSIHPLPPDSAKATVSLASSHFQPQDTLPVWATSAAGDPLPIYPRDPNGYLPVYFRSSDTTRAQIGRTLPSIFGIQPGPVTFYASTTAFGVKKVDTLEYRIGWPVHQEFVVRVPNPFRTGYVLDRAQVSIAAGGVVMWDTQTWAFVPPDPADTVDITFDDAGVSNVAAVRPVYDVLSKFLIVPPADPASFCAFDCDAGGNILLSGDVPRAPRRFPVPGTYEFRSVRKGLSGRVIVVDDR